MQKALLAVVLALLSANLGAALRLPSILSDHMVLQQGKPVRLWGWADPGATVTVSLGKYGASAKAGADGRFQISLPAMPAGGPHSLKFSAPESRVLNDVLIGDVWLGSGQSNMEFAMQNTHDASKTIPAANFPSIRLFAVDRRASSKVEDDAKGSWKVCSPEEVKAFSAVAYHFGMNLHKKLKKPVGLIASSWGGTPAEAWTPRAALDKDPVLAAQAKLMAENKAQVATWSRGLDFEIELKDLSVLQGGKLKAVPMPEKNWTSSAKPGAKTDLKAKNGGAKLVGNVEGGGWASLSAAAPLDLTGAEAIEFKIRGNGSCTPMLHHTNDQDWDDYGGQLIVLSPEWKTVRVPIQGLKQAGWGAPKKLVLSNIGAVSFAMQIPFWPDLPEVIYNGMISPITNYSIKGVIWYQGESNAGRADQYTSLLSAMIQSWRRAFGVGDFPFLIVQLPNWGPGGNDWVKLRAAQKDTLKVPGTGMIETMGLGDENDIHPKNKTEVGLRLAKLALKQVYKK